MSEKWSMDWRNKEDMGEGFCRWRVPGGWVVAAYAESTYSTACSPNDYKTAYRCHSICFVPEVGDE